MLYRNGIRGFFLLLISMGVTISFSQTPFDNDNVCCDPDAQNGTDGLSACNFAQGGFSPEDCVMQEPNDCGPITADCTTIPIDGGLSLLALAGGGLATAAMRRRREEEEAAQHGA